MAKTTYAMRSPETWQQIMEEFDNSGQSQKAYCQAQGIALGTFSKWRSKLGAGKDTKPVKSDPPLFVQLPIDAERGTGGRAWDIELDLGNGVVLKLRSA